MQIYPESESATLEFKVALPRNDQIVKSVVAFCNHFGGRIIVGVDDKRRIVGIPEERIDEMRDSIQSSIFQSCTPTILPSIYSQRIAEKLVLVIEVTSGMNKPYFKTSEGIAKGTYIRNGASTVRAGPEIIDELKWRNRGRCFDQTPVYGAQITDLDSGQIAAFLKNKVVPHPGNVSSAVLKSYDLVVSEHGKDYPTVGAILLFGQRPQAYFNEAFIIATEFGSDDFSRVQATRDFSGSVIQQIEDAIAFITQRLSASYGERNIRRKDRYEIPLGAIREAVVNAVLHRNYNIAGPIKIALHQNRVEIFSPGGFPGPLLPGQLGSGITYIRNAVLAKVLREIGFAEKLGSGFRIMFDECAKANLKQPLIVEGGNFVKCTLWREQLDTSNSKDVIESLIELEGEISTGDVEKHCGISRATAIRRLAALVAGGKIVRIGKGPGTKYLKAPRK